jgi:SAM-dependent methyltransferase
MNAHRSCGCCGEVAQLAPLFTKSGYEIVRCGVCGLQFVSNLPSTAELQTIYGKEFFHVGGKFSGHAASAGLVNARHRVEAIRRLPAVGRSRWLDVGCATGDFLACADSAVEEASGIELSAFAADKARARGLDVTIGDFLQADVPPAAFDVLSMWDYVEHVTNPSANFKKAFAALKPGGYLALSTGDVDSLLARLAGRFWHLMIPPRHLYFFSPGTMRRLLTAAGFELVQISRPGKRVPLDFAAWKLTTMTVPSLSKTVVRACERLGLGRVAAPVNLYDIMTVYARRPA